MKYYIFISCLIYFLCGIVGTTIGSVLPELLHHYDVSYTEGGQLVSLGSIGFLVGVPISSYLLNRFDDKKIIQGAILIVAFAQLSLFSLPDFNWVLFFNFCNNIGIAILSTITATLLMELLVGRRAVVMSYLEVAYGIGALLMPLIVSFLISYEIWRFAFLTTALLAVLMGLIWSLSTYSHHHHHDGHISLDASPPAPGNLTPWLKRQLMALFILMIFLYAGIEGSLNTFLAAIFTDYLQAGSSQASLSISILWIAMVFGRLATGWIIRKVTYSKFLAWSMATSWLVLILFTFWQNAQASYALIALLGLTMSGIYSITMVYANHTFSNQVRLITSLITGFAGLGSASFPALIGYTMDQLSVFAALLAISGLAILYLLALLAVTLLYPKFEEERVEEERLEEQRLEEV